MFVPNRSTQLDPSAQLLHFMLLSQAAQQQQPMGGLLPQGRTPFGGQGDSFERGGQANQQIGELIRGMVIAMLYQQLMQTGREQQQMIGGGQMPGGANNPLSGMNNSARMRSHLGEGRRRDIGAAPMGDVNGPSGAPTPGGGQNLTAQFTSVHNRGARNQMATGNITVNGRTYQFRSGGHGRGNLPPGNYSVTAHASHRSERGMNVGGVGYSFAMSDKYDPRVGGTRSLLRIHPDGGSAGTMGCIGIVGNASVQRQFYRDMTAELSRNGGRVNLRVG